MLLDKERCSDGELDATTLDRRWLWRLEQFLAIYGTNPGQRRMGEDLRQYLNETCVHHWHSYAAEVGDLDLTPEIEAHRQCLYCHDVEWGVLPSSHPEATP